jgi:ketosteroid isomerase-like protein
MNLDANLDDLRRDVQYLKDRTAIHDCIATHARGCDRHDVELITDTYYDDAVDEHGAKLNPGPEYAPWANAVHAATSDAHLHNITTHTCEIDGDIAHAESYVLVAMLSPDGRTATLLNGRYIDRLERGDGTWKLALRRSTVELLLTADSSMLQSPFFKQQGYIKGTRDRDDVSYERPLSVETPAARW